MTVSAVYTPTITVPPCSPPLPDLLALTLLGGVTIQIPVTGSLIERALRGCELAVPAMSSQAPLLLLLKAAAALKDFVTDLPQNIIPPFTGLAASINRLTSSLLALVALTNPAFAFGQQLLGTIRLTRLVVQGLQAEVVKFAQRQTDINQRLAQAAALGNQQLLQLATCEQQRLAADIALRNRSIEAALGPLLAFANVVLCLVFGHGTVMPTVPAISVDSLVAEAFQPVLDALTDLEAAVSAIAGAGASFSC